MHSCFLIPTIYKKINTFVPRNGLLIIASFNTYFYKHSYKIIIKTIIYEENLYSRSYEHHGSRN